MLGELLNARLRALTWTAHAPPVCVHVFGRKSAFAKQLESIFCIQMSSTFFASASRSCWQLSTRSLRGSESRVTWSRRSCRSNTCLSLSARFPSSCRHNNNIYGLFSRRKCNITLFWLIYMKFLLTFRNIPQHQLFVPEVLFVILNGLLCHLDSYKTTLVAYF